MNLNQKQSDTSFLSIRMKTAQKALIVEAAEREGLRVSSFIIMTFARLHILPNSCLKTLKHCPVPAFKELHGLLGVVNKISGNCQQLTYALSETPELHQAKVKLMLTAAALSDALRGNKVPEGINLHRFQAEMTEIGYAFNQIVKSVNAGKPQLEELPATLFAISKGAATITQALKGGHLEPDSQRKENILDTMRLAGMAITQRQSDNA